MGEAHIEEFIVSKPPTSAELFTAIEQGFRAKELALVIRSTREVPEPRDIKVKMTIRSIVFPLDREFIVSGTTETGELISIQAAHEQHESAFGSIVTSRPL